MSDLFLGKLLTSTGSVTLRRDEIVSAGIQAQWDGDMDHILMTDELAALMEPEEDETDVMAPDGAEPEDSEEET